MENFIKRNITFIRKTWFKWMGALFTALSIVLTVFSWEDLCIKGFCIKTLVFIAIIIFSLIAAFIYIYKIKRENIIIQSDGLTLKAIYGDLMKLSFPDKEEKNKIVVIPVNTCFDTIVDEDIYAVDKPLVSSNTLHGIWIKKMKKYGFEADDLDKIISNYLENIKHIKPKSVLEDTEKPRGNKKSYENGTIAIIKGENNVTFFLLALSKFDEKNNAHSTKESVIDCIKKLIRFYDENGQGFDLYIPLFGTGLSRSGLSRQESLQTIKSVIQLYQNNIHGKFNIVIYENDKDKVSIFD